jgi:hypothetical protein
MNSIQYESLFIGIISSLVATTIFILLSEFVRKYLLPWIADKIYKGVRIDGHWKLYLKNDEFPSYVAEFKLQQWGNKVKGTYFHEISGVKDTYNVQGCISNMYFMYTSEPSSNRKIDAGAGLKHIEDDDDGKLILKGDVLHMGPSGQVSSINNLKFTLVNT